MLAEAASSATVLDESLSAWYDRGNAAARDGTEACQNAVQRLDAMRQNMLDAADIALVSDFMCAA